MEPEGKPLSRKEKRARREYLEGNETVHQPSDAVVSSLTDVCTANLSVVDVSPDLLGCTLNAESVRDIQAELFPASSSGLHTSKASSGPSTSKSSSTFPEELENVPELLPHVPTEEFQQYSKILASPDESNELSQTGVPNFPFEDVSQYVGLTPRLPTLNQADAAPVKEPLLPLANILDPSLHGTPLDFSGLSFTPRELGEVTPPMLETPGILDTPMSELNENISAAEDFNISQNEAPLYEGANINRIGSMAAILSFIQSEHLSGEGTVRLLSLIALHIPLKNNFFKTRQELYNILGDRPEKPNIFHFCSLCLKNRASSSDLCDTCNSDRKSIHYFLHFPLEPQLAKLYSRPGFINDIQYRRTRVKVNENNYEDVYDGKCYQRAETDFLSDSIYNISFMWNTDGVQVFESSLMSMWVLYIVINELPPHKRFLTENLLIAGIWCSTAKPHPNVFLQPIFNDLQTLKNGISVKFFNDNSEHKIVAKLLCGTMDSPARATFMNMKTHSGFYSCFVCLLKGVNSPESGNVTAFPFEENVRLRNPEDHIDHVNFAVNNRVLHKTDLLNDERCCGVKGPSLLFYLVENMFESTAIDAMHAVYLGVMRQMMTLMFDSTHSGKDFSISDKASIVDKRIKAVRVPYYLERAPQSVEKLIHWKASELRTFMFYIALIVLHDVLKPEYFEHLVLFVHGVALLNKSSISDDDLEESTRLLTKFVKQFQILYGLRHMSSNLHLLLHLSQSVKNLGPLFINGCFKFEDVNGRVLNLIHGTRHVGMQVCFNLSILTRLPLLIHNLKNESVKKFCLQMRYKWLAVNVSLKISEHLYCVGEFFPLSDKTIWIVNELVRSQVVLDPAETSVDVFQRLLKDKMLFLSADYDRNLSVSSYVKYRNIDTVEYGDIKAFVRVQVSGQIHPPHVGIDVVDVKDLIVVLFKADLSGSLYISAPVNLFELE